MQSFELGSNVFNIHVGPVDVLGEVPTWRSDEQALYWIDVRKPCLSRMDWPSGARRDWEMPEMIGTFVFREDGRLLVGLESGVAIFDLEEGIQDWLVAPYRDSPGMRFNDGHCDRQGRFWVGTMDNLKRGALGVLNRIDDRGCVAFADQVLVPNSISWSPEGDRMYFSDGREPIIWVFDQDTRTGEIGNRRIFARIDSGGMPDGAIVDAEGYLWSTQYGASRVDRFAPDGRLDRVVEVPFTQPTCVAFGGPEMKTLIITSGRQNMTEEALAKDKMAGCVISLEVDVEGIEEVPYAF